MAGGSLMGLGVGLKRAKPDAALVTFPTFPTGFFHSAAREGAGELDKRLPMFLVLELAEIRMTSRSLRWRGRRWLSSCVDMSS
jgi:hypothetical protein